MFELETLMDVIDQERGLVDIGRFDERLQTSTTTRADKTILQMLQSSDK